MSGPPLPPAGRGTADHDSSWSAQLWAHLEPTYQAVLRHPFLTGLTEGTLAPASFAYFLAQDSHYLHDYTRALLAVGAKAPTSSDTAMFARHAAGAVEVELGLHATLLAGLGLDPGAAGGAGVEPTTRAYTSYLLATCYAGSFAEGLAAVLPCYWIYARVGAALVGKGSPHAQYQQWIDTYAADDFAVVVEEVLALVDRTGPTLGPGERERAQQHLSVTARYEWMFWDAAHRRETWPQIGAEQ